MRNTRATSLGNLPFQIDVSSRDYASIRASLISFIDLIAPEWTDRYPGDPGMALLEVSAYVGDVLNYAIDRAQNESYLPTAQEKSNVRNLLRLIDYEMKNGTGSSVPMCVITEQNNIVLPKGTKFTANAGSFYLPQDVDLPVAGIYCPSSVATSVQNLLGQATINADSLIAYFGDEISESLGVSNGQARQSFEFTQPDVSLTSEISNSLSVTTSDGEVWEAVSNFVDAQPNSLYFIVETFGNQQVRIRFGDGVSGKIPAIGTNVLATYQVGTGQDTNSFGPGSISTMTPALAGVTRVFNPVSPSGGKDPETIEEAKVNGPASLRALNRAVTLADFEVLAVQTPGGGVKIARAVSEDPYDVTVYIAAEGTNPQPSGVWLSRIEVGTGLLGSVGRFLSSKKPVATTLNVRGPNTVIPRISLSVRAHSNFHNSDVEGSIRTRLLELFKNTASFGIGIPISRIIQLVENTRGVDFVNVIEFRRDPTLYYLRGNETSTIGANVVVSGTGDSTRSYRYEVQWINADQFKLLIKDYGYASSSFSGKPLIFNAGEITSVFTYPSSISKDSAERFKQFDLLITRGNVNPANGDVWGFANDAVVGSLVLSPEEILTPSLNSAGVLDALTNIQVSGGI